MAGNTFGELFRITTFGESHGAAIGVVVDGVPPNIEITKEEIQQELDRRRPGQSSVTTSRQETDQAEILSGVLDGRTTGTSLALLIRNKDQKSADYDALKEVLRPGHADFTYLQKYGIRDWRGGGRASGRETAARVAAGAIAKKILAKSGIQIIAYTLAVGEITAKEIDYGQIEKNPVRAPDAWAAGKMVEAIEAAKAGSNSIGGIIEAVVKCCPPGLGDPVFDKTNALLAHALLSLGGLCAIEFGDGFASCRQLGSEHNDPYYVEQGRVRPKSNHAGGISGGITTGEDIILRVGVKPTSSIAKPQNTVTADGKETVLEIKGRHDPCLCPRLVPVVEAMIALVLVDRLLLQRTIR